MNIIADGGRNINYSMFDINSTHGSVVEPLGIYKEVTKLIDYEPLCGKGLWALNKSNAMFAMKRKVADVLWKNTSKREFWSVKNCLVGSGNTELRRNENGAVLFSNVNLCKSPHKYLPFHPDQQSAAAAGYGGPGYQQQRIYFRFCIFSVQYSDPEGSGLRSAAGL